MLENKKSNKCYIDEINKKNTPELYQIKRFFLREVKLLLNSDEELCDESSKTPTSSKREYPLLI